MSMSKKAQGLPINTIILIAIGLLNGFARNLNGGRVDPTPRITTQKLGAISAA